MQEINELTTANTRIYNITQDGATSDNCLAILPQRSKWAQLATPSVPQISYSLGSSVQMVRTHSLENYIHVRAQLSELLRA